MKGDSAWEPVIVKKKLLASLPEGAGQREEEALLAVREALQGRPEPYHISYCLNTYTHTSQPNGPEYMYYITK